MSEGGYRITDQYATYFLTFTVVGWVDLFTRKKCRQILIDSLKYCQINKGLILYSYIIMSNHMHLIAAAREETSGLSGIIRDFKRATSKEILIWIRDNPKERRRDWLDLVFKYHGKLNKNNNIHQVWKQNNKPMICMHPLFTLQKLNYIHNNPVKAGIVDHPEDYIYSSARNYALRDDVVLDVTLLDFGSQENYMGLKGLIK